tara:strand:+ start:9022 stop:9843 length:822 start_codon:yes stop_codon:yes gene_type:complete
MTNSINSNKSKSNFIRVEKNYRKNGFVIIKNFINKKIIQDIRNELTNKKKNNKFFYYETIKKEKKLRRIERISDFSKKSKHLICSIEILKIIENLEKSKYELLKDKLNFKYPGGRGYLPHIDGHFYWRDKDNKTQKGWKKYGDNLVNLVLPLEKTEKKNGCIYVAKKEDTEKLGKSFAEITKKMIKSTPNIKKQDLKFFKFYPIEMNVGDVCFFNWKCAHFSKKNNSKNSRMMFYATYYKKNLSMNKNSMREKYYKDKFNSKNGTENKSLLFQ